MKKKIAIASLLLSVAVMSLGCTSSGMSSFCRSGSLWPSSRTSQSQVYLTGGSDCNPCAEVGCNPCDAVVPDPCMPNCVPMGTIIGSAQGG
ncbi:MAG TPA: hypothetical protein DEB39_13530 [Planctomycetaceae bacterium]|nr:hypothetical protein [Planctomycetaceae bacterium]